MFTCRDEIEESLREAGVKPKEARILAQQARPAVRLNPHIVENEESVPLGVTKIGGRPDYRMALNGHGVRLIRQRRVVWTGFATRRRRRWMTGE